MFESRSPAIEISPEFPVGQTGCSQDPFRRSAMLPPYSSPVGGANDDDSGLAITSGNLQIMTTLPPAGGCLLPAATAGSGAVERGMAFDTVRRRLPDPDARQRRAKTFG